MNYSQSIDKANALIRELEIDDALEILHSLLVEHPTDLELIGRIYALEVKRPQLSGFEKICTHIFSLRNKESKYRQLIWQTYGDYLSIKSAEPEISIEQLFNLVIQLADSPFEKQVEQYKEKIKTQHPDHPDTPETIQYYCEQLIAHKKLIKVREDLKYLIAFYAETEPGRWALKIKKWVDNEIN